MTLAVGITCYHTFGGSGIVATEIGLELARRGHQVHFICVEPPARLEPSPNLTFHAVELRDYPLLLEGQYPLALASQMIAVSEKEKLDILHVHYALPHATSAYLAKQILGPRAPRVVTTLHGTDVVLVGNDPSYLPITRFSIEQSDGVTAPSAFLAQATRDNFGTTRAIEVIPNFVDTEHFSPGAPSTEPLIVHSSNFRPLKRVDDVLAVFERVRRTRRCRLALLGDGPERPRIEAEVRARGLADDVTFLGEQLDVVPTLRRAQLFLLPSETESFGLAALEALACGVPVVASRVGGLPEVVREGEDGFLLPLGDVDAMAAAGGRILDDPALHRRLAATARAGAVSRFARAPMVSRYEAFYEKVISSSSSRT
ncbi:MAG: N-acetyl-alpha-D-glucosaminyl L-malate synthase BshA [Polyangia bacterium]